MPRSASRADEQNPQLAHSVATEFNDSPTDTPFQTRAHSPELERPVPHTTGDAQETMQRIERLYHSRRQSETVDVSVLDGSASVPLISKIEYIVVYFFFNLGLTLFNKAVMIHFPFPFLITALHAGASFIGTSVLKSKGYFTVSPVDASKYAMLGAFSMLYTTNIAISNLSLSMVTIPFHQTLRGATPVFTVLIYRFFFGATYTKATYASLIPVVLGVGLATYGDYYASIIGFVCTLFGAVLASVKTVATNRLQTAGLHLGSLELLYQMSWLAWIQALLLAYWSDEAAAFQYYIYNSGEFGYKAILILLLNGAIAFGLNVYSFVANKKTGALTMTVAGNVKQILTILLSVMFWNLAIGKMNAVGIALTLLGGGLYGYFSMTPKAAKDTEKGALR